MSLLLTFVHFSGWMYAQPQLTEMNVSDREIWNKQKAASGIHRVGDTSPCISEVVLFKTGMRKGWPVTTQDSVSQILIYIKRHKEAHNFCSVDVSVFTRKRIWKA